MVTPFHGESRRAAPRKAERLYAAVIFSAALATPFVTFDSAWAQETRADVIRQEQGARQQQVRRPEPNGVERLIDRLEDWGVITGAPRGFYPWFGSVYPGAGFAA